MFINYDTMMECIWNLLNQLLLTLLNKRRLDTGNQHFLHKFLSKWLILTLHNKFFLFLSFSSSSTWTEVLCIPSWPDQGSNSWPPDHNSTFHVTEMQTFLYHHVLPDIILFICLLAGLMDKSFSSELLITLRPSALEIEVCFSPFVTAIR